jgi:pimeloyl-ACP methyl ester carboxylesterase
MNPRLVLVHGSGLTERTFAEQVRAFPESDAVSLPGHPHGIACESVGEYAAWLDRYVRWRGPEQVVVAGHSLGGAIALRWALDFPERVAGLVLIATGAKLRVAPSYLEMIEKRWPECIPEMTDKLVGPSPPPGLRADLEAQHALVGQHSTLRDYRACDAFDVMNELTGLAIPTLVVVGTDDRMTPPKYARYLHEQIAGSQLAVIEDAGHMVMAEKPDQVNAALRSFLASLPEAR